MDQVTEESGNATTSEGEANIAFSSSRKAIRFGSGEVRKAHAQFGSSRIEPPSAVVRTTAGSRPNARRVQ